MWGVNPHLQIFMIKRGVHMARHGSAYRREMTRLKEKRLRQIITTCGYNPSAGYIDYDYVDGVWQPVGKYIKYPKSSKRQKFYKKYSNRIVRRSSLPTKGNGYRRHFDYWWEID